jgi:hypothetical protein
MLSAKQLDNTVIEELIKYIKLKSKIYITQLTSYESSESPRLGSESSSIRSNDTQINKLRKYYKKVLNTFYKIFRQEIPYENIKNRLEVTYFKPEDAEFIPKDWNMFMAHLFHYWTGIKNYYVDKTKITDDYNENNVYNITITSKNTLVESHTCFYNIQVPINIKATQEYTFEEQVYYKICESMVLDKKLNGNSFSMA